MSTAILKRPRQLLLAALMAIVLSASTLGAFGAAQPAAAGGGAGVYLDGPTARNSHSLYLFEY